MSPRENRFDDADLEPVYPRIGREFVKAPVTPLPEGESPAAVVGDLVDTAE